MKDFTPTLTPYDIFIGILYNFPGGRNRFNAGCSSIIDFIEEQSEKYSILKRFTRSEFYSGLDVLLTGRMLNCNMCNLNEKEFSPRAVAYSFENFSKAELFGEDGLKELKDLSRKFVERFG